ncbi:HAD family hydrolase [Radiobacillus deserti]|nr:HAD family hydrolase [Radiobacillus deserti]
MIKLFVSDLDGTLLEEDKQVSEENQTYIKKLTEHGIEFAVATGRSDRDIVKLMEDMNVTGHRVSQNGAFVFNKGNEAIFSGTFDRSLISDIHELIEAEYDFFFVSTATDLYVTKKTEEMRRAEEAHFFPLVENRDLINLYGKSVFPTKISIVGDTERILELKKKVDNRFGPDIESYLSDEHCVDILPKGISKASGIDHLLHLYNLKPEEIAVVGDSFNDVPMMQMTPNSFAMSHARDEVKKHARHIVDHVHEAIRYFL